MKLSRRIPLFRAVPGLALAIAGFASGLEPGESAPQIAVQDLHYTETLLTPSDGVKATVLFFFSNTCPVARRYMARMSQIHDDFHDRGVRVVGINASPADPVLDVAQHALEYHLTFPVYKDPDFRAVESLDVSRTPEIVVLDRAFVVAYRGRIDDQYRLGGVLPRARNHDLVNALEHLIVGSPVAVPRTQAEGCAVTFPMLPNVVGELTYHDDVAPVLKRYCLGCHGGDSAAPFRLDTYDAVRGKRDALLSVLRDRSMPPWYSAGETAVPHEGLSPRERHLIVNWFRGEAREGHPRNERTESTSTGLLALYPIGDVSPDPQRTGTYYLDFSLQSQETRWVTSLAAVDKHRAGNRAVREVHLRYAGNAHPPRLIAGPLVPGRPLQWGNATGIRVPANAVLRLTMVDHNGSGDSLPNDAVQLHVETTDEALAREMRCLKRSFPSPEGKIEREETVDIPADSTVHAVALVLSSEHASTLSLRSSSEETTQLLSVPVYNPAWPLTYHLDESLPPPQPDKQLIWSVRPAEYLRYEASGQDHRRRPGQQPLQSLYLYVSVPSSADR